MQVVSLSFISEDAQIRYTTVPSLLVSIIDCIKALSGKNNNDAAQDFRRICSRFPEFEGKYTTHKFPGQGQRETPVTDLETVLMIMQHVPGPMAQQYREWTARVLREHITKDKTNPLNGLASEERAPLQYPQQAPVVSSPYSDMADDQGTEVINIKATVARMGIDQNSPFYEEYQRHLTEVAKENMLEMATLQMKLVKTRANNTITIEKAMNETEKEKAAAEKEKVKTEKLRQIQEQKLLNLQILNAEMEYSEKRLDQERKAKEAKEMRVAHTVTMEQKRLDALKLKKERAEMKASSTAVDPVTGEALKRKRGRPPKVVEAPVVPVTPVGVMLSEEAVNRPV